MKAPQTSAWSALDAKWFYLGRALTDGFEIATLVPSTERGERLAAAFTAAERAAPLTSAIPVGVEVLAVEADDLRAKEEWLRAVMAQGAVELAFDPEPVTLRTAARLPLDKALWYILSQRRATACL